MASGSSPRSAKKSTSSLRSARSSSGSGAAARSWWLAGVQRRHASPGPVRPARPARWSAEAWEMGIVRSTEMPRRGSNTDTRSRPVSTTARTPGRVTLVSAMLVASTTVRGSLGRSAASCWARGSRPWRGRTGSERRRSRRAAVRMISPTPGKKASTCPSPQPATASCTAAATASREFGAKCSFSMSPPVFLLPTPVGGVARMLMSHINRYHRPT